MTDRAGSGLVLGIETSCDETAAAVVARGEDVLSNVVWSQIALHARFGGVVPELASREHLRHIVPVVHAALEQGGVGVSALEAVAVTSGPGLAGALLVGVVYAKSLAFGLDRPLIAVNHLEGHIHAVVLETRRTGTLPSELPLLALVVSGGHTHLYLVQAGAEDGPWRYQDVGRTVDDAAGEAFDKVAKLLGLGYPGGPWIDQLAAFGDPAAVPFQFHPIKPRDSGTRFDFSFSGIKTAVLRLVEKYGMQPAAQARQAALKASPAMSLMDLAARCDRQTLDLIASFQAAVVGNLMRQSVAAAEAFGARGVLVSGGVAANSELRRRFTAEGARRGLPVAFPTLALSTDNAAMIAAAAWPKLRAGQIAADGLTAVPQWKLG